MKTLEGLLKDKIKKALNEHKIYYFMPVQTGYGATTVDFLCCVLGRFVGIETKAPGRKPTRRQQLVMEQIEGSSGIALWCDNWEDFVKQFNYVTGIFLG
jgi:hypothetical protein